MCYVSAMVLPQCLVWLKIFEFHTTSPRDAWFPNGLMNKNTEILWNLGHLVMLLGKFPNISPSHLPGLFDLSGAIIGMTFKIVEGI